MVRQRPPPPRRPQRHHRRRRRPPRHTIRRRPHHPPHPILQRPPRPCRPNARLPPAAPRPGRIAAAATMGHNRLSAYQHPRPHHNRENDRRHRHNVRRIPSREHPPTRPPPNPSHHRRHLRLRPMGHGRRLHRRTFPKPLATNRLRARAGPIPHIHRRPRHRIPALRQHFRLPISRRHPHRLRRPDLRPFRANPTRPAHLRRHPIRNPNRPNRRPNNERHPRRHPRTANHRRHHHRPIPIPAPFPPPPIRHRPPNFPPPVSLFRPRISPQRRNPPFRLQRHPHH